MTEADWSFPEGRYLAYVLAPAQHGKLALFVVLNAAPEPIEFALPAVEPFKSWTLLFNTGCDHAGAPIFPSGAKTKVPPRSVLAFEGAP
jgi:isoamylase